MALRDITERKRIEKEQQFLAEAGAVLAASLDYEQTLATVAQLVVRDFADWCIVDVVDEHEHAQATEGRERGPIQGGALRALEQMPIDRDRPHLVRSVVETKRPLLVEHVTSEYIRVAGAGAGTPASAPRHWQSTSLDGGAASDAGTDSSARSSFVSSTPSRAYGQGDLRLAEALADRAAVAIENARLYRASVHATQLRDQVLGVVAHDLRNPLSTILMQAAALKRHGPEPERRSQKPAEAIQRAATRMNRLIQDLLDVALMEAGQLTIEPTRLSCT